MLLGLLGTPDRLTETAHAYITLAGLMGAVSETLAPRRGQAASGKEQHVPIAKRRVYGPAGG